MNKNTLIVYGTKHGSVENCASILAKKLGGKVEIKNLKQGIEFDLSKYDRVIIGGSIYMGRIQKQVTQFCLKNIDSLKEKKIGVFICCMNKNNEEKQLMASFPNELLNIAVAKDCFGGEYRVKKMSFFEKFITKAVTKKLSKDDKSSSALDLKEDVTTISENSIDSFVRLIENS